MNSIPGSDSILSGCCAFPSMHDVNADGGLLWFDRGFSFQFAVWGLLKFQDEETEDFQESNHRTFQREKRKWFDPTQTLAPGHRLWEMCALDHRCAQKHPASHSDAWRY